ncbi:YfhO family protein [Sporolactobacillus sp. THM19-2]|uniref:YfhO family protein n=1 Tax=Sporolactobacillus sp. THM19-2 TaxID=2511171 RepID=UPI001020AE61|nr:YfhO family protein [Sporolactobacillus sp. THM19-2]RYL93950.1 hypothetical protein EWH91_02020 [Sporolactobacillus sp. THM19-2]
MLHWRNRSKSIDPGYLKVFLLCLLTAGLMTVPFIIKNGGLFTLVDDFNFQQIPFNMQSNEAIKSGNVFWNWHVDLGSSFIGAFSFYTLGSPFFWLSLLFPSSFFPYLIGPLLILKYCVAGLTAYAFIKRYVSMNPAIIGALIYAFSGFSTVNLMFNHFHDVVALFPLLMVGLDKLVLDRKSGWFAVAVLLNALLNYFFFVGEVVFLILYFCIRYLFTDFKVYFRSLPKVLFEGCLGVGMACFLLLPSILFTIENPRASSFLYGPSSVVFDGNRYLMLLKALFLPADIMPDQSAIIKSDFSSSSAYLPLFSVSLVVAFLKGRRNWLSRMTIIMIILAFIPVLNSLFYALNAHYYARWFYMPVLIMALISAIVLNNKKRFNLPRSITLTGIMTGVFILFLMFYPWNPGVKGAILHEKLFLIYAGIALGGLLLSYGLIKTHCSDRLIISCLVGMAAVTGWVNIYKMQTLKPDQSSAEIYHTVVKTGRDLDLPDDETYRVNTTSVNHNLSLTSRVLSDNSFSSTINGSIFKFYNNLGHPRTFGIFTEIQPSDYALKPFLSEKYYLTLTRNNEDRLYKSYDNGSNVIYVYRNKDYLPVGFTYDYYMTETQFRNIPPEKRHLALLKAVVISDERVDEVRGRLRPIPLRQLQALDQAHYRDDVQTRNRESSYSFSRSNTGFISKIHSGSDKVAFFSVPFDKGWKASVNGVPVQIIEANGFMALPVEKGNNTIRFRYMPSGLKAGSIISALSLVVLLLYLTGARKLERPMN